MNQRQKINQLLDSPNFDMFLLGLELLKHSHGDIGYKINVVNRLSVKWSVDFSAVDDLIDRTNAICELYGWLYEQLPKHKHEYEN